jgi:hypothetical protein
MFAGYVRKGKATFVKADNQQPKGNESEIPDLSTSKVKQVT